MILTLIVVLLLLRYSSSSTQAAPVAPVTTLGAASSAPPVAAPVTTTLGATSAAPPAVALSASNGNPMLAGVMDGSTSGNDGWDTTAANAAIVGAGQDVYLGGGGGERIRPVPGADGTNYDDDDVDGYDEQ